MRRISAMRGVWLCAALAACQGSPTAPDRTPAAETGMLPAGRYLLSVGSPDRQNPTCTRPSESSGLFAPTIAAFVTLSVRGDGWVGRLDSLSEGTLELELRQARGASAAPTITGTLRGTMTHALDSFLPAPPRTASFAGTDGAARIDVTLLQSYLLMGTASGEITFTHTSGPAVACPQASLILGVAGARP